MKKNLSCKCCVSHYYDQYLTRRYWTNDNMIGVYVVPKATGIRSVELVVGVINGFPIFDNISVYFPKDNADMDLDDYVHNFIEVTDSEIKIGENVFQYELITGLNQKTLVISRDHHNSKKLLKYVYTVTNGGYCEVSQEVVDK